MRVFGRCGFVVWLGAVICGVPPPQVPLPLHPSLPQAVILTCFFGFAFSWILAFWFRVCVQIVIIGWLQALRSVLRFSLDLCSVLRLGLGSGRIVCVSIVFVGWLRECAAVAHAVD